MHLSPPGRLGCCPFLGSGSVVDGSLFYIYPIICGGGDSVIGTCFVMSCDCSCSVALPLGAIGRSPVCDCGIS